MMQEIFYDESNRSMKYTKIDHCQDNISIDNDDYYKQIIYSHEQRISNQKIKLEIILTNRTHLIFFIFLIFTSQTYALPLYQAPSVNYNSVQNYNYNQQSLPVAMVQLSDRPVYPQSYKMYRRFPNQQVNTHPGYSNAAVVQVRQPAAVILQNHPNEQQLTLQLRRERQRRAMIDKMVTLFDEDGNGQLTKEELYSLALRSNIFPKFHYYLKQTPI
ncbi:hypothetical protein I4U23_029236 [Adineta vaga]|nr:hypothetical protein I4U23_029236 [Adineta vaga]